MTAAETTTAPQVLDTEMAGAFLDLVFGIDAGFVALGLGRDPYWTDDEPRRYHHREFTHHPYRWPDERELLLADVGRELLVGLVDVYVCPALRKSGKRRKGDAVGPLVLWADLDGPPADPELLAELHPVRVASGQDGHEHIYVPLGEPVTVDVHNLLNKGLAQRLSADHKWSDETLLRLPGTVNHKTTPPSPVVIR